MTDTIQVIIFIIKMKSPFLTSIRRLLFVDRDSLFIKSIVDGDVQTAEHFIRTGSIDINCQSFKYKEVRVSS